MWGIIKGFFGLIFLPIRIIFTFIHKTIVYTVIGMVAIVIFVYKDVKPPELKQLNIEMQDYMGIITESEIQKLLTGTDDTIRIGIPEAMINREIHNNLYGTSIDGNKANESPVIETEFFSVQGVWVEFDRHYVNMNIGVHLYAEVLTYKTNLRLRFDVHEIDAGVISLRLRSLRLGNLPLRWAVVLATEIIDLEAILNESLADIGEFSKDRLELKLDLMELLGQESEFMVSLLQFAYDNDILELGVVPGRGKYILGGTVNFEKLRLLELPTYHHTPQKTTYDELVSMVEHRVLGDLFTRGNQIEFNETEVKQIIDYMLMESIDTTDDYLFHGDALDGYELFVHRPYTTIGDRLMITIPIEVGRGYNLFMTSIQFELSLVPRGNDLLLIVERTYLQSLEVNKDLINLLLVNVEGELSALLNEGVVVENFFEAFVENGVTVQEIVFNKGKMIFRFNGFNVNDMLTEILDTVDIPEINHIIKDILDIIDDEEKLEEHLFEMQDELIDIYQGLSEEEKQKIMDIVGDYIDRIPNFEN